MTLINKINPIPFPKRLGKKRKSAAISKKSRSNNFNFLKRKFSQNDANAISPKRIVVIVSMIKSKEP